MHYHHCYCRQCNPGASPLPVLLLIAVALVLLALSSLIKFEVAVASAEEQIGWILLAALPLVLLFAVRWLSSRDMRKPAYYFCPCGRWKCVCYY